MAKPIFVITIAAPAFDIPEWYEKNKESLKELYSEYHIFLVVDSKLKYNKYQLLSDKDIEPIQLEELKRLLKLK